MTVTEAGRAIARRLPFEAVHGRLGDTVRARWRDADGFVLCCAAGVAVRVVAPLLGDKHADPAVVCIDEAGRFAIALCGGHAGGANDLAREVAALLGAQPVVSTATDAAGLPALDALPGFVSHGDVAGVSRLWLDGHAPLVETTLPWPVPFEGGDGPGRVLVTDEAVGLGAGEVALYPPSLVVGIGASSGAPADAAADLLACALVDAGLSSHAVGVVATIDRRAGDPVVTSLGRPVRAFPAATLAGVVVPNPSDVVAAEVGTPSVAEAAALLAAGPGARLVVEKRKGSAATVAIARRAGPVGSLTVVGLGPGHPRHRTPAATTAVRSADVVIGYGPYVDQCADLLSPAHVVVRSPIGAEADRCAEALRRAAGGARVALVCSGDPGVFAMACLVLELAPGAGGPPVEVVPGVTAAAAAGALLGAPFGHDHAFVSLSDLLTPWAVIEDRLRAVADGDFAVALYNPRSKRRTWQLDRARELLLESRPPGTPVGIVTDATRPGESLVMTTLAELDTAGVGMLSVVVVGNSSTTMVGSRMVTPRGYRVTGPGGRSIEQLTGATSRRDGAPVTGLGGRSIEQRGVHPIETESYRILAERVDLSAFPDGDRAVVARMIHATADVSFAETARVGTVAVQAAVGALRSGVPVVVDAAMVAAGMPSLTTICLLAEVPVAPPGSTRSAAAIALAAARYPTGAIWVIGNAPTALVELLALHEAGVIEPAAVIGVPVGFVGAAEAKAALWASPLAPRSITTVGERGGSPVAAAAVNALIRLAEGSLTC